MDILVRATGDSTRRQVRKPTAVPDKHNVRARRADDRDGEVGRRVRSRRLEQRLSQTELAGRIGVTFQQVQKYEKGMNRIGAGRLQRISEALEVPVTYFFSNTARTAASEDKVSGQVSNVFALAQSGNAVRLMTAFSKIASRKQQKLLVDLAEGMAEE